MWQIYAFGAVLTSALESVFDKAAIVQNVHIEPLVATFWRPFLYTVLTIAVGLTGIIGPFHFFFHWSLFVMALFGACTSLFYTYILKRIELTSISSIGYLAPIVLVLIDTHVAHSFLTAAEITGIVLLAIGGLAFTLDGRTFRFKKELTALVWGMFIFNLVYGIADAYLFKYLNTAYGVNGVSFFSCLWLLCSAYIFLLVLWKGKVKLLLTATSRRFIANSLVGKSFDSINSVLWAQALVFAAVSQVNAFDATYPLVLFLLVLLTQGLFKIPLGERIDRRRIPWKVVGTILLVAGGLLVG